MLETQPNLDRWRLRARTVEEPETGSDLALDDRISFRTWRSVNSHGCRSSSPANTCGSRSMRCRSAAIPLVAFTVLRGALVGASQGVWILSPGDRRERRERGLTVFAEMYSQMGKYYNSFDGLCPEDRERLDDEETWLKERRAGVAAVRKGSADLNLTDVIRASAVDAFASARCSVPRCREHCRFVHTRYGISGRAEIVRRSMTLRVRDGLGDDGSRNR